MNDVLVQNWNKIVQPEDTVYHLGDFAFGTIGNVTHFRSQLNGNIHLVRGNHDKSLGRLEKIFGVGKVHNELSFMGPDDKWLWLTHKPRSQGAPSFEQPLGWHLHGHVHGEWVRRGNAINVGVDVWGFQPVSLEELLAAKESP